MFELLEIDKNANDQTMQDACYTKLKQNQPEKLERVENTKGGWDKFWDEVIQSEVTVFCFTLLTNMNADDTFYFIGPTTISSQTCQSRTQDQGGND